ncbi:MAG: hypothetical protein DELT_00703 [Desulfovibrio sp.]
MTSLYEAVVRSRIAGPEPEGETVCATFIFTDGFTGFEGHFPGNPIVPGIAQVYAVQAVVGAVCGHGVALRETIRCKFTRPVLPNETVRVAYTGEWEEGTIRCKANVTANGQPCSSMTLLLEKVG